MKAIYFLWGLIGPIAFCLAGCSMFSSETSDSLTKTTGVDNGPVYKMDMIIQINGKTFEGMGVVPLAPYYDIAIDAKGTLNLLTVTNCHRDIAKENAFEKGFFKDKSKARMKIQLFDEEESDIACPMNIAGFEVKGGRHSWGFIDFQNPKMKLQATTKCNGVKSEVTGVAVCQGSEGTLQFITFPNKVLVAGPERCPEWVPNLKQNEKLEDWNGLSYKIEIGKDFCSYRFKEQDESGEEFRITTRGYSVTPIRELL